MLELAPGNPRSIVLAWLTIACLLLAGCTSLPGQPMSAGPAPSATPSAPLAWDRAPGWRYTNAGARHTEYPGAKPWADHLKKLSKGVFARDNPLPPGHVLDPAEARRQFAAGGDAAARGGLAITWFGHASFLIRANGVAILTDPIFSEKSGPAPFGIRRMAPVRPDPAIIEHLDAIIVSHADYDHMDRQTLIDLRKRFPGALLIVPAGTAPIAASMGYGPAQVLELPWYETQLLKSNRITAVSAVHGVRRLPWPINFSHWNGYRLDLGRHRLYFAGDTGAGDFFGEISRRAGPADIAMVPAGAWSPRDFEKPFHVNPTEAMELAVASGAREAIAMHWGTFPLSQDKSIDQKQRFLEAGRAAGLKPTVMRAGETRVWR